MHRPRKRFGQNFLKDRHVLDRIMAAAAIINGENVVEIGPGLGALTDRLLASGAHVTAVEIDRDLGDQLAQRTEANLSVIVGDVLKLDWSRILVAPPYKLVANLPYNISSQVLFKVIDHRDCFVRLVLMFQKEVGERLVAEPGTKDYGILSVLLQTWYEISRVVRVPPNAFYPPPKVDSVVVKLELLDQPRTLIKDVSIYRQIVRGAFSQRRKTLRNSLLGSGFAAHVVDSACIQAGIDAARRGETLTIPEFGQLANSFIDIMQGEGHV